MCKCCYDLSLTVIGNNAIADATASPVVLTVDRPLTDMGVNYCFDLYIPVAILKNSNTSQVQLSDGTTTLDIYTRSTDFLRYDSLVVYANNRADYCCRILKLRCNLRSDPAPGHVYCKACLPRSSYVAVATAAAPDTPDAG